MSISSDQPLLINQLPISQDLPKDPEKFHETLSLFVKRVSNVVNTKTGGLYSQQEFSNSELYQVISPLTTSNVYRKCFDITALNGGNIAGGATAGPFNHNITGLKYATLIYAGCTSTTNEYFTVMGYPDIFLNATQITFTNTTALILSQVFAVCEYLKN